MPREKKPQPDLNLVQEWTLPPAATLGSSVRTKGIVQELRARLPLKVRRSLDGKSGIISLRMAEDRRDEFDTTVAAITNALVAIEALPILPREIEDILAIKTSERHRWLKDGRLASAGTRTVKLRGRARSITFHVFDPRVVEDLLSGDTIDAWREDDALTAAENRRRAAWKSKLRREAAKAPAPQGEDRPDLVGFDEFAREFLLR
jgi:hypothetical protein